MAFFVVATFKVDKDIVGARVVNSVTGQIHDMKLGELVSAVRANKIKNLGAISTGRGSEALDWKYGAESRYPSINKDGTVDEKYRATVMSTTKSRSGEPLRFKLCNFEGKIVSLDADKAVAYGNEYGLTNCKVSYREGKKFIQSICGELEDDISKIIGSFENDDGVLRLKIPTDGSVSELDLGDYINNRKLTYIMISPSGAGRYIKKLTFPKSVWTVSEDMIYNFRNVETLVLNCGSIGSRACSGMPKLKNVYMTGCNIVNGEAFADCPNLENVVVEGKCYKIGPMAFKNCPKLNIDKLLQNSITVLGSRVFYGCSAEEVTLGLKCGEINYDTFQGLRDLKQVTFLNLRACISDNQQFWNDNIKVRIANYCSDMIDTNRFRTMDNHGFRPNTVVEVISTVEKGSAAERAEAKAQVLGLGGSNSLVMSTNKDLAIMFRTFDDQAVRDLIVKMFNQAIVSRGMGDCINEVGPYKLRIDMAAYWLNSRMKYSVLEVKNGIVVSTSKAVYVFPTSKKYWVRKFSNEYASGQASMRATKLKQTGKVDSIVDTDTGLEVTFRNKNKEMI